MTRQVYALLGRKDEPTDAVEEYCRYLGAALKAHEIDLQICRVPWEIYGWRKALRALQLQAANWRDTWVFVQYTALAWSSRGFPLKFLRVLRDLKSARACVAIVFHDVTPYSSPRLIDQLRYRMQLRTMRRALQLAERAIFTVPLEKVCWLDAITEKAVFIPVGPNLPFPETPASWPSLDVPTIGVFSITGGEPGERETRLILDAVRHVSQRIGPLRLLVFGRHAELRENALRQGLQKLPVQLSIEGILDPDQVVKRFAACDVLFFVRNGISTRRSSAIAGIAAGLPIIAYANSETAAPITDAGLLLVNPDHPAEFGEALLRVLTDGALRGELADRSRAAYQAHFAWSSIATRFVDLVSS